MNKKNFNIDANKVTENLSVQSKSARTIDNQNQTRTVTFVK